ncbi:MAG: hypothetical protein RIR01_1609 [Bacteroidota bacterium]|jgi:hypothetical protein
MQKVIADDTQGTFPRAGRNKTVFVSDNPPSYSNTDNPEDKISETIQNGIIHQSKKDLKLTRDINHRKSMGYLLHHFFPDEFGPERYPDYLSFPTHCFTEQEEFVIKADPVGKALIIFNPAISVQDPVNSTYASASEARSRVWFMATNGSMYTDLGDKPNTFVQTQSALLMNVIQPQYVDATNSAAFPIWRAGLKNGSSVNKCRLLSSTLKITYIGKPLDASGWTRVGVNVYPYGTYDPTNTSTDVTTTLPNLPLYGSFPSSEELLINYRHVNDNFYALGPYPSNTGFASHIIFMDGLSPGSSFRITINRSFEAIVNENIAELVNPLKEEYDETYGVDMKKAYGLLDIPPIITSKHYEKRKSFYLNK